MMKNLKRFLFGIVLIAVVFLIPGCGLNQSTESDPATFDEFADSIFNLVLSGDELSSNYLFEHPENFGLERYEPSLPTPSTGSILGTIIINYYFEPLYTYDYNKLSEDQQMTYLVLDNLLTRINEMNGMNYLSADYLGSYLGYQAQLPLLLIEYNFKDNLDILNYFKYLELVPNTFKKYVDFEIEKADNGYGMPNYVIDKVIDQCDSFVKEVYDSGDNHFMITMFNQKLDKCTFVSEETKANYIKQNKDLVNGSLVDGYNYVKNNLSIVYDRATNNMGLAYYVKDDKEIGKEYYRLLFKDATGYDVEIEDAIDYLDTKLTEKMTEYKNIYQLNPNILNEVSKIQLMNVTPEEQLEFYQEVIYQYFPELNIDALPKTTIRYVDESMEDHFSPAAYMVSAIDNYNEEFIYLNNKSIHKTNGSGEEVLDYNYLYTTIAHEGFPGHMYQNIYFKNTKANVLRKILKSGGYVEGWATYAQLFSYVFVADLYNNDALRFLKLNDEISGIIQARLDMGIHYEGWTKDLAEAFLGQYIEKYNKTSNSYNPDAINAIYEQLVEVPTNAQKYYFTYLKLEDMYNSVYYRMGKNFDIIDFHKTILDCGPMPLRYVENIVNTKYGLV